MNFGLYGRWRHDVPISTSTVALISECLRPGDDTLCVWLDERDAAVLRTSVDVAADNFDQALALGREVLTDAASVGKIDGHAVDVIAMTENEQATWAP